MTLSQFMYDLEPTQTATVVSDNARTKRLFGVDDDSKPTPKKLGRWNETKAISHAPVAQRRRVTGDFDKIDLEKTKKVKSSGMNVEQPFIESFLANGRAFRAIAIGHIAHA
jgi:hypothetical protein